MRRPSAGGDASEGGASPSSSRCYLFWAIGDRRRAGRANPPSSSSVSAFKVGSLMSFSSWLLSSERVLEIRRAIVARIVNYIEGHARLKIVGSSTSAIGRRAIVSSRSRNRSGGRMISSRVGVVSANDSGYSGACRSGRAVHEDVSFVMSARWRRCDQHRGRSRRKGRGGVRSRSAGFTHVVGTLGRRRLAAAVDARLARRAIRAAAALAAAMYTLHVALHAVVTKERDAAG